MCQACGGICGAAPKPRRGLSLNIALSGRTLRIKDAGGPMPLYVSRALDPGSGASLRAWARQAGFSDIESSTDMHVTVAYSRAAVDWFRFASWRAAEALHVPAGGPRRLEVLGGGTVVLRFVSEALTHRWQEFRAGGCSWDWPEYAPHVTIAKGAGSVDPMRTKAFAGSLAFGPEEFAPIV